LFVYGVVIWLVSPRAANPRTVFNGADDSGRPLPGWWLAAGVFVHRIFARPATNAAGLAAQPALGREPGRRVPAPGFVPHRGIYTPGKRSGGGVMFRNREEAAEQIASQLGHHRGANPLVLAVPRGGVPMGRIIADRLDGELDVVLVHKLGAPGNPEFAIGSVDETGHVELNPEAQGSRIEQRYIDEEADRQLHRIRARREHYGRPPADAKGRVTILVDDGIATGATLLAAIRSVRVQHPGRLVVGIAVAPPETAERVAAEVDELVCLQRPSMFMAVGQFFDDFRQVEDEEVIDLLGGGRHDAT